MSASRPACCSIPSKVTSSHASDRLAVRSSPIDPPSEAWMVAGGVGLAPFATLGDALIDRGTKTTLFYGARSGSELFYLDWFEKRGIRLVLATEDGSIGDRGRITVPLERELQAASLAGPS